MMKITGLSHLFKWENLHNWWLTKYFFAPLCVYIYIYTQCPSLILEPLVNMTKGGCENKSALFILFIFHSKNSQNSKLHVSTSLQFTSFIFCRVQVRGQRQQW